MLVRLKSFLSKLQLNIFFPLLGIGSLLWFLIRVIPKPGRATYPCMRAAAPIASSFVAYLLGLTTFAIAVKKAKARFHQSKILITTLFIVFGLAAGVWTVIKTDKPSYAKVVDDPHPANQPIGEAKGIFPGRVVWVHNPDATNENCINYTDDYWWMDKNNNQEVIDLMLSQSLQQLTGKTTDEAAWDALFHYFNQQRGKGDVGYTAGEQIAVKINLGCEWSRSYDSNYNWRDDRKGGLKRIDSTPHLVLAMLKQLVQKAGIPQENIGVGDMIRNFTGPYYDICHGAFPNIQYWAVSPKGDRVKIEPSDTPVIFYSDGKDQDRISKNLIESDYLINLPCLKAHARAGITIAAKNHFGSHSRNDATHLHRSLPCPEQNGDYSNGDMGNYRCLVDLMGHEHLGGKTMLIVVDGLWGAGEAVYPPNKWHSEPFNDDWPSSLIVSQDPVAIESVCFDFLYQEYDAAHYNSSFYYGMVPFPQLPGTQDYLHQAADPANWPAGIVYDPEKDGTPLTSLGVHEHWNNPTDKQYTCNLGTGNGIELVKVTGSTSVQEHNEGSFTVRDYALFANYPNPFNSSTTIQYQLSKAAYVQLAIYNMNGQLIKSLVEQHQAAGVHTALWDGTNGNGSMAASGIYVYKLRVVGLERHIEFSRKMLFVK